MSLLGLTASIPQLEREVDVAHKIMSVNGVSSSEVAITQTNQYFTAAVEHIDRTFGRGYAKKHPDLVAAYVQSCNAEAVFVNQGQLAARLTDQFLTLGLAVANSGNN